MSNIVLKFKFEQNKNIEPDNYFWYEDLYGNVLSKEKYRLAKSFFEGYAFVYTQDKTWDIINAIGESVFKKFNHLNLLKTALEFVSAKNGFFLKNYKISENVIISIDWSKARKELEAFNLKIRFSSGVTSSQACLVINYESGKLSLIEDYSLPGNSLIAIKHFNKDWIFITLDSFKRHGLEQNYFDQSFEFASGFNNGLAKVKKNGYFGFINTRGIFIIDPIFDDARSFSQGYAAVAVANLRNDINNWNSGRSISDFGWNYIDKDGNLFFKVAKEQLTSIHSHKNFYFKNGPGATYTFERSNLNPDYYLELHNEGFFPSCTDSIGNPYADFWYSSKIWGQFCPDYLVDLLTAQLNIELGLKPWAAKVWPRVTNVYNQVGDYKEVIAETIFIDFDTTQSELDFLLQTNSLEKKYGNKYSSQSWKEDKMASWANNSNSTGENYETDWNFYNDDLDMDQQSIEFWNQF